MFSSPVDYPVHDIVAGLQDVLLGELLAPPRLRRMVDNTARMPRGAPAYTVGEMFETLTGAIWSELGAAQRTHNVDSFRRNLQRAYVERFTEMLMPSKDSSMAGRFTPVADAPEDARALARYELTRLSRRLGAAENATGLDLETRAHFAESKAKIDRALRAVSVVQ
jgi:hypothetical protein